MSESNPNHLIFLPEIAPAPTPPSDSGDSIGWEAHIKEMDKYILNINTIIEEMETRDFPKEFKQRMAEQGIDIDKPNVLPKSFLDEMTEKVNGLLEKFKGLETELGVEAGTHRSHRPLMRTNRSIQSI